ncbi:oligopeptide transporter 4 [Niveomyces insectorum RCEF 264]|uniref:Oligopeptide transporter 4 n=1 Tax=Niveomyces insectorum RCEF 264 TaxID=1081102 RepID=A0A167PR49_9HYPO|nr:oligopeptide transporter 4 [Niveomyces insectorum RCEF 264]
MPVDLLSSSAECLFLDQPIAARQPACASVLLQESAHRCPVVPPYGSHTAQCDPILPALSVRTAAAGPAYDETGKSATQLSGAITPAKTGIAQPGSSFCSALLVTTFFRSSSHATSPDWERTGRKRKHKTYLSDIEKHSPSLDLVHAGNNCGATATRRPADHVGTSLLAPWRTAAAQFQPVSTISPFGSTRLVFLLVLLVHHHRRHHHQRFAFSHAIFAPFFISTAPASPSAEPPTLYGPFAHHPVLCRSSHSSCDSLCRRPAARFSVLNTTLGMRPFADVTVPLPPSSPPPPPSPLHPSTDGAPSIPLRRLSSFEPLDRTRAAPATAAPAAPAPAPAPIAEASADLVSTPSAATAAATAALAAAAAEGPSTFSSSSPSPSTQGNPIAVDASIPSTTFFHSSRGRSSVSPPLPPPSSLSTSSPPPLSSFSVHPPPHQPPLTSPAPSPAVAAVSAASCRSSHGTPLLEANAEETVHDSTGTGNGNGNGNGNSHTPVDYDTTYDDGPMTRETPAALRSSPGFASPSYGAVAGGAGGGGRARPSALNTASADTTDATVATDAAARPSSRHATLRRKRSQAASLLGQNDALTGGSVRGLPAELEAEALLGGLGGGRFDAAGTAAPVSAVPSEISFDGNDKDDEEEEIGASRDPDDGVGVGNDLGSGISGTNGYGGGSSSSSTGDADENDSDDKSTASRDSSDDIFSSSSNRPPDDSPFAQVRASVAPVDNIALSINTPRMWVLSMLFSVLGSATNLFFSLRYPSVAITPVIALLLVHPLGLAWDFLLKRADDPPEEFFDGVRVRRNSSSTTAACSSPYSSSSPAAATAGRLRRLRLWLAQGRWNEKEHTCVYVSSNVSFGFAFATDVIVEQTHFYKQDVGIVYQLLLTLSTQILGYAFAGLSRRFLVRPSGMIWPATLMSAAMFATLHKAENKPANGWRVSRWHFFYAVFLAAFAFYFLPGLLMPALSYFNVVTWFAPDNVVVANLFGVVSGLGLFPVTFDWAQVAYIGSPLLTPFWAAMNVVGGLVVVMWIVAPLAYYGNWLYTSYMPILSAAVFDNTGQVYDVSRILTPDFVFDRAAYANYSRVFLPITYVLSYGVQFAGLASLLTHTACWHGRDIWRQWRRSLHEAAAADHTAKRPQPASAGGYQPVPTSSSSSSHNDGVVADAELDVDDPGAANLSPHSVPLQSAANRSETHLEGHMSHEDVHNRLMRRYRDVPMLWYLLTFVSMTAIGIFVVEYYPIHLPWYGLLLALGICAVLFIPIGIIMAVTNQHVSIYLICQLVCGAVFPGRPVANMVFVTYGYISSAQGIKFAADLRLGHYMKIPPRILFHVQMAATLAASVTQIAVLNWMFRHVPGLCTPSAVNGFTCPIARVHFNGSILWGVVGPGEFFGRGAVYRPLVWSFLVGALAPIPLWLYSRRRPHKTGSSGSSSSRRKNFVRKINLPVLLGSIGWIPPATGLNFSVWALVCYVFNYRIKHAAPAWWAKYTMTLSAALDAALASGIVVVFFVFVYPGLLDRFHWWGTEVYRQGCDWQACAYRAVPEGGRFGPETW